MMRSIRITLWALCTGWTGYRLEHLEWWIALPGRSLADGAEVGAVVSAELLAGIILAWSLDRIVGLLPVRPSPAPSEQTAGQ